MSAVPLPIVDAGPEALFRVGRVYVDGDRVRGSMPIGPWLAGADGLTTAGSLGVLIDNVLGYAIIASRPPNHWSVSTEITLDVVGDLAAATGRLQAEATTVHADGLGGFALGRVYDEAGTLVASCTQRGRFVAADPATVESPILLDHIDEVDDLAGLLDLDGHLLEVTPRLQNPMRNLHGGIAITVSDLVAAATLAATDGPPLITASIHMAFLRPTSGGAHATYTAHVLHRGRTSALVDVVGTVGDRVCTSARVAAHPAP
jgi:uncharacterized protein (TIGR00369 family)